LLIFPINSVACKGRIESLDNELKNKELQIFVRAECP